MHDFNYAVFFDGRPQTRQFLHELSWQNLKYLDMAVQRIILLEKGLMPDPQGESVMFDMYDKAEDGTWIAYVTSGVSPTTLSIIAGFIPADLAVMTPDKILFAFDGTRAVAELESEGVPDFSGLLLTAVDTRNQFRASRS